MLVDRIQHLVPTFGDGDDFVWFPSQGEEFWVINVLVEEAVDGGLEGD